MAKQKVKQAQIENSSLATVILSSGFSTASTSAVQVTGATLTFTAPTPARQIEIIAHIPAPYNNTNNSGYTFTIWDGAVGTGTQVGTGMKEKVTPVSAHSMTVVAIVTPAAGSSKTYNLGLNAAAPGGTVDMQNAAFNSLFYAKVI